LAFGSNGSFFSHVSKSHRFTRPLCSVLCPRHGQTHAHACVRSGALCVDSAHRSRCCSCMRLTVATVWCADTYRSCTHRHTIARALMISHSVLCCTVTAPHHSLPCESQRCARCAVTQCYRGHTGHTGRRQAARLRQPDGHRSFEWIGCHRTVHGCADDPQ
jgi:hypothetical protein